MSPRAEHTRGSKECCHLRHRRGWRDRDTTVPRGSKECCRRSRPRTRDIRSCKECNRLHSRQEVWLKRNTVPSGRALRRHQWVRTRRRRLMDSQSRVKDPHGCKECTHRQDLLSRLRGFTASRDCKECSRRHTPPRAERIRGSKECCRLRQRRQLQRRLQLRQRRRIEDTVLTWGCMKFSRHNQLQGLEHPRGRKECRRPG